MQPKERDYGAEHKTRVAGLREEEEEAARMGGRVRWRNEARLGFKLEEEDGHGNVVLRVELPRFLDSSLVEVEAHPHHVTVVAKGKLFRMAWPEEVRSDAGRAERMTSGVLVLTMPKAKRPSRSMRRAYLQAAQEAKQSHEAHVQDKKWAEDEASGRRRKLRGTSSDDGSQSSEEEGDEGSLRVPRGLSLAEQATAAAEAAAAASGTLGRADSTSLPSIDPSDSGGLTHGS